jgi:hypothetical protein
MNAVLPWTRWFSFALWICAFVSLAAYSHDANHEIWSALKTGISIGSALSAAFVATPVWRLAWLFPPLRRRLPLLDGVWSGVQSSNWLIIQAMKDGSKAETRGVDVDDAGSPLPALLETPVNVEIRTTFFAIRMDLVSATTGYQNSVLKAAVLTPETDMARGRLTYVFEGRVPRPQTTDVDRFDGAAELEIHRSDDGVLELKGCVWTNRNWAKGLNTAGLIELKRDKSWAIPALLRSRRKPTV